MAGCNDDGVWSMDLEGDLMAIGLFNQVSVYKFNGTTWVQIADINDPNVEGTQFGYAVKLSGDYLYIGAPETTISGMNDQGLVYCYKRNGSSYVFQSTMQSVLGETMGYFGIDIDAHYHDILIGATGENADKGTAGFGMRYGE